MSKKLTTEQFIERAKSVHGNKYDYSKVEYIDSKTKVCIICPKHGEFWQIPFGHLNGANCPECNSKKKQTQEEIIDRFKQIHKDRYDYSKVKYKNILTDVCIICHKHGEFWQTPHSHLKGSGCPKCAKEYRASNQYIKEEEVLKRIKEIHGDKYDYSKFQYNGIMEKSCIICPKHGEFLQTPHSHLKGSGCPKCKNSVLENTVRLFLDRHNIDYVYQYFPKFLNDGIGHQSLDFYIPKYNVAIECQGLQHYKPVELFGGEEQFKKQIELDRNKKELCEKNGIKIIYYSTYQFKDSNTLSSLKKLLYEIKN